MQEWPKGLVTDTSQVRSKWRKKSGMSIWGTENGESWARWLWNALVTEGWDVSGQNLLKAEGTWMRTEMRRWRNPLESKWLNMQSIQDSKGTHIWLLLFLWPTLVLFCWKTLFVKTLSLQDRRAGSQNQSDIFYLEFISGYCPYQTKPFHQAFFNTLYFSFILLWNKLGNN